MKNRPKGGLGRGLGALIPTTAPVQPGAAQPASAPVTPSPATAAVSGSVGTSAAVATEPAAPLPADLSPVPGARFAELPVAAIVPNPKQPRQVFDDEALEELKVSIEQVGFLQPIVVRQLDDGEQYELVMGERRWRAAQAIGRESIPAIVRDTRDDAMLRDALLENIHRANLNPLEEAAAYQQLLDEFGATHEELARRIGRSRPQISNTIRLLNLPAQVQRRVAAGVLSAGHARALLSLDDSDAQDALALRIVAEGLSVRATEELVALAGTEDSAKRTASPQRRPKAHAPALTDLADRLSDRFDTRVKVDIGRSKGKITIEFATVDDLERIVGIIGVGDGDDSSGAVD
ncbi:ParB/RepB/Spo0J family partition protein [Solwaraspora sp. WMMB762]|uniref:ParB/RepB/Spo0J family partition protein n=1 Tax=Solwaraspora sp. WMMB762 TaxID=3404120 RepID=UPI003B94E649